MRMGNVRWLRMIVGLAVLTVGSATVAAAQEKQGFFFGVGLGYGSLGVSDCDGCDREGGLSGHLRLGGALSPQLLIGVETTGWYKDEDGGSVTTGTLTGNAYFYPSAKGGFFAKGGIGLGSLGVSFDGGGSDSETGFGWQVGAGYDIRVGTKTAITPTVTYFMSHINGGSVNVIQAALAFSLY
jgi:hypothetical protein